MMLDRTNRATEGSSVERAEPKARRAKRKQLLLQKKRGMTMIMMLILVPIIMLIAVSYVEPIIRSYRAGVNDQKTLLAKSVADSMFEVALWESRGGGTGDVTHNVGWPAPIVHEFDFGNAEVNWSVFGTPEVDDEHLIDIDEDGTGDWYTIPSPGSGDAGGTYCSTNEPVVNQTMMEDALMGLVGNPDAMGNPADPFDWPCHWNKIREGETVSIPLYTDDGTTVRNPGGIGGLGLNRFDLRIRAACDPEDSTDPLDFQICGNGERYVLDETLGPDFEKTVIVLWEIVGKDGDENGDQMILSGYSPIAQINSFFNADTINNFALAPTNKYPLMEGSQAKDNIPPDDDFNPISFYLGSLYKPTLNIQVIHTLRDNQDNTIPYLEYQFKAPINLSSDLPVSNTSKVVRVDVMVDGGYSETLEKTIALPKPISGFVISQ